MIQDRIQAIESTLEQVQNIPDNRKAEMLTLVAQLKTEVGNLAETDRDEASSITRFADASMHEAARLEKNAQLADTALLGLRLSIQGLEESHPGIVAIYAESFRGGDHLHRISEEAQNIVNDALAAAPRCSEAAGRSQLATTK